jgi:arsenite methyltransferase
MGTQPKGRRMPHKPDYGIDSPAMVISELALGLVSLGCAAVLPRVLGLNLRWLEATAGAYFVCLAAGMLFYSKVGKLHIRDAVLSSIPWRGDEAVLDVGCGRGLLLVGAAKRLTNGRAVGVDVWNRGAISGNAPIAPLQNAQMERVSERVEVKEGDGRNLPFGDSSFDVVLSNFVIHEVNTAGDREKMVSEMVRVVKPGGRVALVDFIFTDHCVQILYRAGVYNAKRVRIGSRFWTILMFGAFQTYLVTGSKQGKDSDLSVDGSGRSLSLEPPR